MIDFTSATNTPLPHNVFGATVYNLSETGPGGYTPGSWSCDGGTQNGATISVQNGMVPKHLHPNTNEMQFILEGTGTIWLGDKQVTVKPGDLVVIPKGTPHGGTSHPLKAIAIKTPPQAPDDTKLLN